MTELISSNFIGCGKLGKTMAYLLASNNLIKIQNIYCRSIESAQNAVQFIGQGDACIHFTDLRPADIYFICTPDDAIEKTCQELLQVHNPNKNATFIHFSGILTSDCLKNRANFNVGSLHPLKSFAIPEENIHNFTGTYCAFEGAFFAEELMKMLMQKIGGIFFKIEKENKEIYHAAAVFCSNYLVTLAELAKQCFEKSGIPNSVLKGVITSLIQGTVNNISSANSIGSALTGPLQRGDIKAVEKHLQALEFNLKLKEAYILLGNLTLSSVITDEVADSNLLNLLRQAAEHLTMHKP